jgi:hypothetical protein
MKKEKDDLRSRDIDSSFRRNQVRGKRVSDEKMPAVDTQFIVAVYQSRGQGGRRMMAVEEEWNRNKEDIIYIQRERNASRANPGGSKEKIVLSAQKC